MIKERYVIETFRDNKIAVRGESKEKVAIGALMAAGGIAEIVEFDGRFDFCGGWRGS